MDKMEHSLGMELAHLLECGLAIQSSTFAAHMSTGGTSHSSEPRRRTKDMPILLLKIDKDTYSYSHTNRILMDKKRRKATTR